MCVGLDDVQYGHMVVLCLTYILFVAVVIAVATALFFSF